VKNLAKFAVLDLNIQCVEATNKSKPYHMLLL